MNFEASRTRELLEAEEARGGPRPVAAYLNILLACKMLGLPAAVMRHLAPEAMRSILMAHCSSGEARKAKEVTASLVAILSAFANDLSDLAEKG